MCRWLPAAFISLGLVPLKLLYVPEGDEVAQICRISAVFLESDPTIHLASFENVKAYEDSCRETFPSLGARERELVLTAARAGNLEGVLNVSHTSQRWSMPYADPRTCHGSAREKQFLELDMAEWKTYWTTSSNEWSANPLHAEAIHYSKVADAWKHGLTATFDARQMLPESMFNVTWSDISDFAGEARKDIPVGVGSAMRATETSRVCTDWLPYFTQKATEWGLRSFKLQFARKILIPLIMWRYCPDRGAISLERFVERANEAANHTSIPYSVYDGSNAKAAKHVMDKLWADARVAGRGQPWLPLSNMNGRHLPKFADVNLGLKLGLAPGELEATHSLLWTGTTPGAFHTDYQDNVLIQLSGSIEVIVFPANCAIRFLPGHLNLKKAVETENIDQVSTLFYHVKLRAGEGLVVPSMAWHKITSRDSDRITLNGFMEPKFDQMRWPSAPANFFRRQDPKYLAMRVLWLRSMKHLFDTRKIIYFMHTFRIEYV